MDRIYEHANEQHVRAIVIYKDEDNLAYEDAEMTKLFTAEALENAFLKGCVVRVVTDLGYTNEMFRPVAGYYREDGGYELVLLSYDYKLGDYIRMLVTNVMRPED